MKQLMIHQIADNGSTEQKFAALKENNAKEYFGVIQWYFRKPHSNYFQYRKLKIEISEYHRLCRDLLSVIDYDGRYNNDNTFNIIWYIKNGLTHISVAFANNPENKITLLLSELEEIKKSSYYFEAEINRLNNQ